MSRSEAGFAGYACWTAEAVHDVIPYEAVAPSDSVFLSTHYPCRILKRPIGATSGGVQVSEETVLRTFLETKTDLLLMNVIGQPGTGKSHLIRWLRARLPESPTRRLIYVPKDGTSLRRVIELILEQMEGAEVANLREALERSADRFNEAEAPTALLDALARTLEFRSDKGTSRDPSQEGPDRRWIAANLPVMLRDAVFREHLLRPGGVIQGFVDKALRGSRPTDKNEAFAFSAEDFPVNLPNLAAANQVAKQVHSDLSSDPALQTLAAQMLTDQLGPAISDVFGLSGASSLTAVMRRTRQALAAAGKELLILIEDFTVLQGIQRELLDALIAPPVIDGVQVLCPIRAALAVTSGHFAGMEETITSRAGFASDVFVLDLPYGQDQGWSADAVKSFAGRYLNAARLGQDRIENAGHNVPNGCDLCPHRIVCHDSFGTSDEGYGLYPFNADALDRCVKATVKGHFDPRAVLGNVVRFTLDEHEAAIRQGTFPGRSFDAKYQAGSRGLRQLPIMVREQLAGQPDGERYATLLTFWANCPEEILALESGIHEAFQLPARSGAAKRTRPSDSVQDARPVTTAKPAYPASVSEGLANLEEWAAGSADLRQRVTNDLRGFLFETVWARVEWADAFLHPGQRELLKKVFNEYSIQFEGSPTRRESNASVNFTVARDAQAAAVLRGILLARHHGGWRFDDGDRLYRMFSNRVEAWGETVLDAVDRWRQSSERGLSFIEARVMALAVSARILGIPGAESTDPSKVLEAALAEAPGPTSTETDRGWKRIRSKAATNRAKLREELLNVTGGRQGATGRARAVNPSLLLAAIKNVARTWELGSPDPDDTAATQYVRALSEAVKVDLPVEQRHLVALRDDLRESFPGEVVTRELGDLLVRAGDAAATVGSFSPADELDAYRRECLQFKNMAVTPLTALDDLIAQDWTDKTGLILAGLAKLEEEKLQRLSEFGRSVGGRLAQTLRRLDSRLRTDHGESTVVTDIRTTLDRLASLMTTPVASDA